MKKIDIEKARAMVADPARLRAAGDTYSALIMLRDALDELEALRAEQKLGPVRFCDALDTWAKLMGAQKDGVQTADADHFASAWHSVRFMISKSCLLDRTIYHGRKPSQTPCPVHEGRWAGVHWGWPGSTVYNPTTKERSFIAPGEHAQSMYDRGCRCFLHGCGCTTGWQPDEHSHGAQLAETMKRHEKLVAEQKLALAAAPAAK